MSNYKKLRDYVQGKISEMMDCDECRITDHEVNHLMDIESYINQLEADEAGEDLTRLQEEGSINQVTPSKKKYDSACTFSFTVKHDEEDCSDVSDKTLIRAIRRRLKLIEEHNISEIREAVLPPYDTVEEE